MPAGVGCGPQPVARDLASGLGGSATVDGGEKVMARSKKQALGPEQWSNLSDEELCRIRIRDLGLEIAGSPLEPPIQQLHGELDACGVRFHPPCYLADEWLCPDRVPMIGIPFCLAHPRLKRLQEKIMLEVVGGTEPGCIKLLRHEAGHAINYAYRLYRRTRWRELYGPFSAPYGRSYDAQPYSRRYVVHLEDHYAQAHPDEDFAETLAVCITPGSDWRRRYTGWPAIKKLTYVDHLIREIGPTPPLVTTREELNPAARMTSTLGAYYDRMKRSLGEEFPGFYDPGLQRLFVGRGEPGAGERASSFLRRWRRQIVDSVCMWTRDRKFDVNELVALLARRCRVLGLCLKKGESETLGEVVAFVAAVMNRIHYFAEQAKGK